MHNIGPTLRRMIVPFEWIRSEDGRSRILDSEAIPVFKDLLDGKVVDPFAVPFLQWRAEILSKSGIGTYEEILQRKFDNMEFLVEKAKTDGTAYVLPASLDANGIFRLQDGHHRAALAIAAGETGLTLDLQFISPTWLELERKLLLIYNKKYLYQAIPHPWFDDWIIAQKADRIGAIREFMEDIGYSIQHRVTVDVGSCTGNVVRAMAEMGASHAVGFEIDANVLAISEHLNTVFPEVHGTYYQNNAIEVIGAHRFALVSCLSVLHHQLRKWAKGPNVPLFKHWLDVFGNSADLVFIDTADPNDPLLATDEVPIDPPAFMDWMKQTIGVKSIRRIFPPNGEKCRPLYAYSKVLEF